MPANIAHAGFETSFKYGERAQAIETDSHRKGTSNDWFESDGPSRSPKEMVSITGLLASGTDYNGGSQPQRRASKSSGEKQAKLLG
jgi:hypothetical protein